ncbi:hypothetical protein M9Y10_017889 [Tritrichomonas musculus]|uniref:Surface antigen BspA-like n=1 Tax=Tritrichomonas musculus TaxID=1915356 RepID=A0ABR2HWI3_9EUKA
MIIKQSPGHKKENLRINHGPLIYVLNEEEKTATVVNNGYIYDNVFIPRSIKHEMQDFIVTKISENSFDGSTTNQKIEFPIDSEVRTIERNVFINSSVTSILFPASVCELEKGWCNTVSQLTNVKFHSNNRYFKNCEENDNLIVGKSDVKSDEYDILIFASRDIQTILIPASVKIIGPFSLQNTKIQSISISPHITKICESAFSNIVSLQKVQIPSNSQLRTIEKDAFANTSIKCLSFPQTLCELKDGWCAGASSLQRVTIDPNNKHFKSVGNGLLIGKNDLKSDVFDVLFFVTRSVEFVTIPSSITIIAPFAFEFSRILSVTFSPNVTTIGENAFAYCNQLHEVEIPLDSQLKIIGKFAFDRCSIDSFFIPPHVTKICENAFYACNFLQKIVVSQNSELQTIEKAAFSGAIIESLTIPSSVTELQKGCLEDLANLKKVTVDPNNRFYKNYEDNEKVILGKSDPKNDDFDVIVFACRDIQSFTIPSNVKIIASNAFEYSNIDQIFIPPQVTKICKNAFAHCTQLRKIEIPPDSELRKIGKMAFSMTQIESIFIPCHVTKIGGEAFYGCDNLEHIEIPPDSELESFEPLLFTFSGVKSVTVPPNFCEFKERWNFSTCALKKVSIHQKNRYFKNHENLIVGKSDVNNNDYDVLIYAYKGIMHVTIPPDIKVIMSYAFQDALIKKISIPSSVALICEGAFDSCNNLECIEFAPDSKLQAIERHAFKDTRIKSFVIPPLVKYLDPEAFSFCDFLQILEIDENTDRKWKSKILLDCYGLQIIMVPCKIRNNFI